LPDQTCWLLAEFMNPSLTQLFLAFLKLA
jgi:hypothetical protein